MPFKMTDPQKSAVFTIYKEMPMAYNAYCNCAASLKWIPRMPKGFGTLDVLRLSSIKELRVAQFDSDPALTHRFHGGVSVGLLRHSPKCLQTIAAKESAVVQWERFPHSS